MQSLSVEGFQISLQQKRLWSLTEQSKFQSYNVQGEILIEGNIDYSILEIALQKIIGKYEIFRTNFLTLQEIKTPLQVIKEKVNLQVKYNDFSYLSLEERNLKIESLSNQNRKIEFNLNQDQVLDLNLIKISDQAHILLVTLSSFCADINSLHLLVNEIAKFYSHCLAQREINNEPLQYADIAAWQNELFTEKRLEINNQYWHKQNIFNLIKVRLPSAKNVDQESEFCPKSIKIDLAKDSLSKIEALAKDQTVAISTILMTCWQVLLWRLVGKSEIAIATYYDGRNYAELALAFGLLARYLPVQINLNQNEQFLEVLKQLEVKITEIDRWQESFDWSELINSNKQPPFLPFAFDFVSQPTKYCTDNISFLLQKQYACIDRFNIKLTCWLQDDSLITELHYDANLFEPADIERLAVEWQTIVASAVNHPETAIAQLEILSPQARQQLLVEFNQTEEISPAYECVYDWFAAQADSTPNNVAVVYEDEQLTYQELQNETDKIANRLRSLGVKPEVIVALSVERSPYIPIGILGILQAGGAYLPLEPSLPADALAFRLQDAEVAVLLTQKHLVAKLEQVPFIGKNNIQIVCLDEPDLPSPLLPNPLSSTISQNLAYVIYTSGSTGKPKGVAVEHRQVLNYLTGILARLNLLKGASFATVSTFAADLGNTAIFSALCTGGCLHIVSEERATDPVALADYIHHQQIDCLKIVPSHLSALLTYAHPEQLLPRQRLILGGEALTWDLVAQIQKLQPSCQIFNHYGPTETAIGVLTYPIDWESIPTEQTGTIPLGRPLAGSQIYLLDEDQKPVPIGVPGEIYIGGNNVTRGYLNRPELTEERFILSPFNNQQLYKTGDRARYYPDGNLEFLGRVDHQIKLNGFRIELAEIEAVLRQHPQVEEVVVLAREDKLSQRKLVAYLVWEKDSVDNLKDLRAFVAEKLPEYMLPAHFIQLKSLPLTSNGKIDRSALPVPEEVKPELTGKFVAPSNSVEIALAQIWSELLGIEQVGIFDNFFELGGDSIISIQAIARANQIGLRLTPKQIFEHQTIAKLAAIAETVSEIKSEQGLVTGEVPLTPIQLDFFEQNLPQPHHWNQSVLLELKQDINPQLLSTALQHLFQHHDALRMSFRQEADAWQAYIPDVIPQESFTRHDLSYLSPEEQTTAIELNSAQVQTSLNLAEGSLVRVVLFDLGHHRLNRLLIVIHHLVIDSVSWRILLADFQTAIEQLHGEQTIQLPAKTTSWQQWGRSLEQYAQTKALDSELGYWRLGKHAPRSQSSQHSLPKDYPTGINQVSETRLVSASLSEMETQALLQQVPAKYNTQINDVLLTALVKTFALWTNQRQLLVNLEGHGREEIISGIDLSRTVGWFTTVFPVLLDLGETSSIGDGLKRIKEQLRSIPKRGINYGILQYLNRDRPFHNSPPAEVCFNYLGQFDRILPDSSLFNFAPEASGADRSTLGDRRYLIEINGLIVQGKLQLDWGYSQQIYSKATIVSLAENFLQALRDIIVHCQTEESVRYTPTDFPKANLSQQELDRFLTKINQGSEKQ